MEHINRLGKKQTLAALYVEKWLVGEVQEAVKYARGKLEQQDHK